MLLLQLSTSHELTSVTACRCSCTLTNVTAARVHSTRRR